MILLSKWSWSSGKGVSAGAFTLSSILLDYPWMSLVARKIQISMDFIVISSWPSKSLGSHYNYKK